MEICLSSSKEVRIKLTMARYRIDGYAKNLKRLGRAEAWEGGEEEVSRSGKRIVRFCQEVQVE